MTVKIIRAVSQEVANDLADIEMAKGNYIKTATTFTGYQIFTGSGDYIARIMVVPTFSR